jgi:hypothetical protein
MDAIFSCHHLLRCPALPSLLVQSIPVAARRCGSNCPIGWSGAQAWFHSPRRASARLIVQSTRRGAQRTHCVSRSLPSRIRQRKRKKKVARAVPATSMQPDFFAAKVVANCADHLPTRLRVWTCLRSAASSLSAGKTFFSARVACLYPPSLSSIALCIFAQILPPSRCSSVSGG